jgi:type I restriction enzyme M protein
VLTLCIDEEREAVFMFEQTFKNIDDILHKDAGCSSELDYVEQTSWVLFLKYLDDLEKDKKTAAELSGKAYKGIVSRDYQWEVWAAPKGKDGNLDHHKALGGDDLKDFVDQKLFPYLKKFKANAEGPDTIEYKIGEIFSELKNKVQSGYNLREVINLVNELRFRSHKEKHEMSHLYEAKIKNMGNAGRNGGEYYTPRPLIKAIVEVVAPKIGYKIYDGAVGSAGFLCEAFEYLKNKKGLSTKEAEILQKKTFFGKEKKSLAYIIGIMNMILHGIEAPNILHTNTLAENLADIQDKDRFDVILANPPFGGKERKEVQQNFPIRTGETAFLFLQHFIKILKAGGRGGVVIKNTFLSNTDNASVSLRKLLLESCNLHTVLDCPGGTFQGAGVKTVVLFFEKGAPTRKIWFYQLDPGRNLGKTNPLNDDDLAEFVKLQKNFADSPKSWSVDAKSIDQSTFDLSVKNPNGGEEVKHRSPQEIMDEIVTLDAESAELLRSIKALL